MERKTEASSKYDRLEEKSIGEILREMNGEDKKVAEAVGRVLGEVEALVGALVERMKLGGRLFYIGAGTSGRLGVLDASEIWPTFGLRGRVVGVIAGGESALRSSVEGAEDDMEQGWRDIMEWAPAVGVDSVVGIASSGTTPYVVGALRAAREVGLLTGAITSNPGSAAGKAASYAIEVEVGGEYVTGSSRLKSGSAQKMVLNMISTSVMIKLGRVKGNKMVHMQLSNAKLVDRGARMVSEALGISYAEAEARLLEAGSVVGAGVK
jgi:N-acetylmuramic acid 6-phosphate etherase